MQLGGWVMIVSTSTESVGPFAYLFALALSGGSLLIYAAGALVSRYGLTKEGRTAKAFNLGLPSTQKPETLFAISLAAAQTTFSTVFVVFLTEAGGLGLHLLYCPLAFALGNFFMLIVYKHVDAKGYIDRSSISGLVPYLVYRLVGSRFITACVTIVCVLPIVAVLALELHYGIPLLSHLSQKAFPFISLGDLGARSLFSVTLSLGIFACFMVFLLGYVFLGGFRAVVTSDVWQYRIMFTTLTLVSISLAATVLSARHRLSWGAIRHPTDNLVAFYVGVTVIDLFQPLCFATTWQRFRAFKDHSTDFNAAVTRATVKVAVLWIMLIFIGLGFQLISPGPQHEDIAQLLDRVAGLNVWFQLFVFPLLVLAGFSGMYSSSDTCISSLLYLTEANRAWRLPSLRDDSPLRRHYYWVMGGVFLLTLCMYFLYVFMNNTGPGRPDPAKIALTIFGSAVVLAPTVLLLTKLSSESSEREKRARAVCVGASVILGFVAYWTITVAFPDWAIISGLLIAAVPTCLLLLTDRHAVKTQQEGIRANV